MDHMFLLLFTCEPNSFPVDKFWIQASTHSFLNKGICHLFCQYLMKTFLKEDNKIKYPKSKQNSSKRSKIAKTLDLFEK